ncbi:hypothetical protein COV20_06280 [Candidatus Woesearchaeota archaeon CG10_big_fil_rev_8_21_14_0_10_45_16]|nr:MAG: hypothetical protein COV20_06280 [Candidatus Woesearchaeota archaeon CG10_big_fil_rev_8_21_14_0_10_45_16]
MAKKGRSKGKTSLHRPASIDTAVEDQIINLEAASRLDVLSDRLNGSMVRLAALEYATMVLAAPGVEQTYYDNPGLFYAGTFLVSGGLIAATAVQQRFKQNFNGGALRNDNRQGLVTDGAHGQLRHPMYVSYFTGNVGAALLNPNWMTISTGIAAICAGVGAALTEERALEARFGQEYVGYKKRTSRFVPKSLVDGAKGLYRQAVLYVNNVAQIIAP